MASHAKAAFFDIDGTLTSDHSWKGLMTYFRQRRQQRPAHLAFTTTHYPLYFLKRLGVIQESTFRSHWAAHLAWYLRGLTLEQAAPVWHWLAYDFMRPFWRADSIQVLQNHLAQGDLVMLVSSGPQEMVTSMGNYLGVEHGVGTRFEVLDGRYTGRSLPPVCIDAAKASLAQDYLRQNGYQVDFAASHTYADSTADLHLLEMTGNPVVVYPEPELREIAGRRGWRVLPN